MKISQSQISTILFVILISSMSVFAAGQKGEVREVTALKVAKPPKIDGRLDEATWRGTALHGSVLSGFLRCDCAKLAKYQPVAYLAYDDENLYLGVQSHVPDTSKLKAEGTNEEFNWRDDLVQIFLEPKLNGHFQYKVFNSKAVKDDSAMTAATSLEPTRWTLEAAIPWKIVKFTPKVGATLGFNLVCYQTPSDGEWLSWAPVYGSALKPERFGYLILGEEKTIPLIPETPEEDDF